MRESRVAKPGEIRVVMLPVGSRSVLLPNPAVAEIIGFQKPAAVKTAFEWLLGRIEWRGHSVPVVSFDEILEENKLKNSKQRTHIAVLNTLNGNRALPYIGLLVHGAARLLRINADSLSSGATDALDSPLVLEAALVNNQQAWIPDLDALESMLLSET